MAEFSLKQQFVRSLREAVSTAGATRAALTAHLGLSASAVSQMLSGDILPTLKRLDQLIEFLHPEPDDAEKLETMLLWLRAGSDRCPSEFNRRLFMARCRNALSIEKLATMSAIPASRLRRLERTAYAEPTGDEAAALSMILGQPLKDGVFVAEPDKAPQEVAESPTLMLPRISVECLAKYSAKTDFLRFVADNGRGFLAFHLLPAEAAAAVIAPAETFGAALPGKLELILGSGCPKGFVRLELCGRSSGRGFFMDGEPAWARAGFFAPRPGRARAAWRLPILQVNHIPEGGGNGQD